jgi:hypothetical protein
MEHTVRKAVCGLEKLWNNQEMTTSFLLMKVVRPPVCSQCCHVIDIKEAAHKFQIYREQVQTWKPLQSALGFIA